MLRGLDISNMLIIDRLELAFQPGLNVLTGETGAGKSILLDALGFVLGWRGRADLVRQGAEQGEVTAWFDLASDHPARAILQEAGLPESDELLVRRVNTQDGRKTAWVNDRRCSGDVLRRLSETLVELHGQHDDRGLLNPRGHQVILDDFAGLAHQKSAVRAAWTERTKALKALAAAQMAMAAIRDEEDFLRHAVAELDALAPQPGEEATLDSDRRRMQGAEKIRADVIRAHEMLGHQGAESSLSEALRWLDGAAEKAQGALEAPMAALGRAMTELDEALDGIGAAVDGLTFNPLELEETEERLFAIRALARKHDVLADDLATYADGLREKLTTLDDGEADLAELQFKAKAAEEAFAAACAKLTDARRAAASKLDAAVTKELAPLKMERAVFRTEITQDTPGPEGADSVAFTVATNPGAPAGP